MHNLVTMSMSQRFRGYLPVVVDVETGGFDYQKNALLEIAAVLLGFDNNNILKPVQTIHEHIEVESGTSVDKKAIEFIGMDPYHPLRFAIPEEDALSNIFSRIELEKDKFACQKALLVGHNAAFDLQFVNAAVNRHIKLKTPFHSFTNIDTATLGAVLCGQTVLARIAEALHIPFDQQQAHSAKYDAELTAKIFCYFVNQYHELLQN